MYTVLAAHSDYSLLRGVDTVEAVCAAAVQRGAKAIALTDVNGLYIAVRFWEVARDCGLAPILGADVLVEPGSAGRRGGDGTARVCADGEWDGGTEGAIGTARVCVDEEPDDGAGGQMGSARAGAGEEPGGGARSSMGPAHVCAGEKPEGCTDVPAEPARVCADEGPYGRGEPQAEPSRAGAGGTSTADRSTRSGAPWAERAILLAADARGYRRLCRILSEYHVARGVPGEAKARDLAEPASHGRRARGAPGDERHGRAAPASDGGIRVGRALFPSAFSLRRALIEDREGLWTLVPCGAGGAVGGNGGANGGRNGGAVGSGQEGDPGLALAEALLRKTGPARLAVMISPGRPHRRAVAWARRAGVRVVATPDAFFVNADGHARHRLLRAIDLNTKLSRLPEPACVPKRSWLMPRDELARHFPDCPEAIDDAARVAAECAMSEPPWGRVVFPRYEAPGHLGEPARAAKPAGAPAVAESSFNLLKRRAYEGAVRRYGAITRAVQERLDRELAIIRAKSFADYFLVVADIVTRSPRTCGRGSAAASLVSYALGITHVDPVRYDLFFERFLNMGRTDPPDIDVDFAWDERDGVLAHVLSQYGEDRAAMVCNHLCFRGRAAVREVAKVYGLPEGEIAAVTKRLGYAWATDSAEEMIRTHPLFKDLHLRAPWPEILKHATALEGQPRHLSVHCGGVVIVPDAVWDHVPIQPSAKGVNVIQWEKDQTEDAGLVKIDLLGNRSLAVIRDTLREVETHHGVTIPFERFSPLEDLRTQDLIRRGETVGVFYVESPAMRQLQEKTRTGDFDRLVVHSSIIRPAANTYIREYVRRLRGGGYRSIHPLMDEIMPETFGIMVYQEDVAKIAIAMAGFDAASADDLRKVLSKKHKEKRLADYRERFHKGAEARGFTREVADQVWEMILSFSGYSFCKPHSASYALVSFKSAYLKAHYPAEFMAAVISNQGGYYSTFAYISECRRMGLKVLLPDVNASAIPYTGRNREVRVGLMQIQGMKGASGEGVVAGREEGPYRTFEEFLSRAAIDPADVRLLVRAGACDSIAGGRTRPELMWRWAGWSASRTPADGGHGRHGSSTHGRSPAGGRALSLFADDAGPEYAAPDAHGSGGARGAGAPRPAGGLIDRVPVGDYSPRKVLTDEIETLGFLVSRHPLALHRDAIARLPNVVPGRDLRKHVGREITTVGWLVTGKVVDTKKGEPMEFISFEDTTALYETTFFPEAYRRFCHMLSLARPYVLRGKVEEEFDAVTLTVRDLRFLG